MEKQHGVDIMTVEIQIEWLWIWPERGRESGKSLDGNERIQRDVMLRVLRTIKKVWRTLDVTEMEVGCPGKVGIVQVDGDSTLL